jgi:exosortase C (VPDSG-CTERM-specific)
MVAANSALRLRGWQPAWDDSLCLLMLSFLSFLTGGLLWFLGGKMLRAVAFPFAFLIFIVPFPTLVLDAIEVFFQHTSAEAANLFLLLSGMTYDRDGQIFRLPGITLQVAEECSGIRSSLVLFITSLLAGHLFLQASWRKAALTLLVIPLAIVRNGFRIFVISLLCVHVSPDMINSVIHRHGGPLFFVLSLVPFFLVLLGLRKSERRHGGPGVPGSEG